MLALTWFAKYISKGQSCAEAAESTVEKLLAKCPPTQINAKFWPGPAALTLAKMAHAWKKEEVSNVASHIAQRDVLCAAKAIALISRLPHMNSYGSYAFLRTVARLFQKSLRGEKAVVASMSNGTSMMSQVLPRKSG